MSHIVTVTGEIPADQLGPTLAHEHLYCDVSVHSGRRDNVLTDVPLMVRELAYYREAGGRSIVELTSEDIGRDPLSLKAISEQSGVQVVSGTAFYDPRLYPEWVREAGIDQIADYFVREIEEGREGVRAGLIGELASHNASEPDPAGYRLEPLEAHVFKAAAKAQRRTGVAISTHASLGRAGHAQLNVLEDAGADLGKVVIGHCDVHWHKDPERDMEYYLPILQRGACCGFDMIGWTDFTPDEIRAERIAALIGLGYESQLLLGSDTCRLSLLHEHGGRGFDFVWESFLPRLRALSVSDAQIASLLVETPQRLLSRS